MEPVILERQGSGGFCWIRPGGGSAAGHAEHYGLAGGPERGGRVLDARPVDVAEVFRIGIAAAGVLEPKGTG
jgi:hypothetical protein